MLVNECTTGKGCHPNRVQAKDSRRVHHDLEVRIPVTVKVACTLRQLHYAFDRRPKCKLDRKHLPMFLSKKLIAWFASGHFEVP